MRASLSLPECLHEESPCARALPARTTESFGAPPEQSGDRPGSREVNSPIRQEAVPHAVILVWERMHLAIGCEHYTRLQLACIWIRSTRGQDREYLAGFGLHPAYSRFRQTTPRVLCKPAHSTHSQVCASTPLLTCPFSALSAIARFLLFFSRHDSRSVVG